MKRKLLYMLLTTVILFTSTGFGFLESSTAVHRRASHSIKTDSTNVNSVNMTLNNTSIPHKEIQKTGNESITKTVFQWVSNIVKNTVEQIITFMVKIVQSFVLDMIKFFTR